MKCPKTNTTIAFVDYQSKLGFGFQSNGYIIPNCGSSSDARKMYSPENFIANEWNHIVLIRDDNFTDVVLYINGELQTNRSGSNQWDNSVDGCFIGGRSQGTHMTCYINDFRVYDHCLSPMEVKQISQGLVLHYPLNRNGWGQENLATNTSFSNSNIEGYGGQKAIEYNHSDWTSGGRYFVENRNSRLTFTEIQANQPYTISAWVYIYSDVTLSNPGGTSVFYRIYKTGDSPTYSYDITFTLSGITERNKWVKVSQTFVSSYTYTYNQGGIFVIGGYNGHFKISMPKVEKGSIATPWCPNLSDALATTMSLNSTTEYDCSGFCNNAQSNGNISLTYSSDAPKYSVSTVFASGARIATPVSASTFMPRDAITVNIWFKSSAAVNRFLSCTEGGGFNFESNSGNIRWIVYVAGKGYNTCNSSTTWASVSDNTWHMLTGTCDKTNMKIYLDGELIQTTACTYPDMAFGYASTTPFTLGAEAQTIASPIAGTYVGSLSDCRIYATALSADDVLSLYQNSAYIDSSGNVYGTIHEV